MANLDRKMGVSFEQYRKTFQNILGTNPAVVLLHEDPKGRPLFHEACIYHPGSQSLFVSSNQLPTREVPRDGTRPEKRVVISRVWDRDDAAASALTEITPPTLIMANGGANYGSGLLFCAQGDKMDDSTSGIVCVPDPEQPQRSHFLISSFRGRPFNSVNDVVVNPSDRSIWFTDPCYGFHQGFRRAPELPSQVYRFDPSEEDIRAMADDLTRPNGLCFSPDLQTLYVTDTGAIHGAPDVVYDKVGKATIYAFDVRIFENGMFRRTGSLLR